ncbi:MAG: FAD-binding oxidoreductase [Steroidobacteraceae bacterium]
MRNYYEASAGRGAPAPALQGSLRCDVCVVGAGLAGLSTALHLAERGQQVVVLEAERVGWGASGRNGGQVLAGFSAHQGRIEKLVGKADAHRLWNLSVEGLNLLKQRIAQHRIDCQWVDGQMLVSLKPRHVAELHAWQQELEEQYGYQSLRSIAHDELRQLVASDRYLNALYDGQAGHLHPLRYTLGMAAAAQAAGVQIFEGTRVTGRRSTRSESGAQRVQVLTEHGHVDCEHLVLAGNAWLGPLEPQLQRKIMGVGTYIVATEPLGAARARALIANNAAITDLSWVMDYYRLSADHRLLFGGRVSYAGLSAGDTANATRARMLQVFPQLADTRIEYSWGGYVDITLNRAPHFGRLTPRVWYLQGFSGHGLALTGLAGKVAAEAIAGQSERFDLFARIPHHDFPGGLALRRPALVLAMLWYRLRDLL